MLGGSQVRGQGGQGTIVQLVITTQDWSKKVALCGY